MGFLTKWDQEGERKFETGVDHGVLYLKDTQGRFTDYEEWNGLTNVNETPSGAEAQAFYADNMKYLNLVSKEDFGATIEAFFYPDKFAECDGSAELAEGVYVGQQTRKQFGFSYRTLIGNDTLSDAFGYKLHLVYNCLASPSERSYPTEGESTEPNTFSWEITTTPVQIDDIGSKKFKPTAILTVDSTKVAAAELAVLEAVLYGAEEFSSEKSYAKDEIVSYADGSTTKLYKAKAAVEAGTWDASKWDELSVAAGPRLPLPNEVASIFATETVG